LVRLLALASLTDRPLSVELAEETLKDLLANATPLTADAVIDETAKDFGLSPAEIRSSRRTHQLALARQVAMYLIRKNLNLSLKEIGICFGGKDHTTVMHAVEKVERLRVSDEALAARLRKLDSGISRG
jgi:chromosomal replication initiator protein